MDIVYLTDPADDFEIIPSKLKKKKVLFLCDSENAVHECLKEKINYQTIGNYIDYPKLRIINEKIILKQRKIIEFLYKKLQKNFYYSEILRDYLYKYYFEFHKFDKSLKTFLKKNKVKKLYFIYDENFLMSPNSIPKGSVIPYLLFLKFKNIYNFEIEIIQRNKKKINSKSNSFNSYFMKFDKFKKKKEKNNPYDLYFFTFNQCYTDLLSCLDSNKEKNKIITFKTTENIYGDFDYENKKRKIGFKNRIRLKLIHKILISNLEKEYKKNFIGINYKNIRIFLKYLSREIWLKILEFEKIKIQIDENIKLDSIKNIYLSGISFNYPIASYLISKKKNVKIRQHGGFSYPSWPNSSLVKSCEFISNSLETKKIIKPWNNKITFLPIYNFKKTMNRKHKNKILIAESVFGNPVNIKKYIEFYNFFLNTLNKSFFCIFRLHPRFKSILNLHFKKYSNVIISNQKHVSEVLSDTMMVLINHDTPNSVFQDAILNNVPVFLISPKNRVKSLIYENNCYRFPYICKNHNELNQYIIKIKNRNLREKIIQDQKKWYIKVFGDYKSKQIISLNFKKNKKILSANKIVNLKRIFKKIFLKIILTNMKKNI